MPKHRYIIYIVLTLFVIIFFAKSGPNPKISPLDSQSVVLAYGDSLTYGTGADKSSNYPAYLSELLGVEVENCGIPGEVTASALVRLPEILKVNRPNLVILCHGGNDILRSKSKDQMRENIDAMIRMIKTSGSDVILIAVPDKGLMLSPPPLYQELAEKYHIPLNEDLISNIMTKRSMKSDYVHPNAKGYKKMAQVIYELIESSQ